MEEKKNIKEKLNNIIIIGGGPAGLSAAIYLARAGLKPLVFAGSPPGGQLILTSEVENYPGYESIMGAELIRKMRSQAEKLGARIVDENIAKINLESQPFELYLKNGLNSNIIATLLHGYIVEKKQKDNNVTMKQFNNVLSRSVIIATGAKALWLGVPGEERLRGKGVSACATCDGFFFREKTVAVVGGGDAALEEALTLTKFATKVYIIHRRDSFRASKIMQKRVSKHPKIEVIWNTQVMEVLGENRVEGIRLTIIDNKDDSVKILSRLNSSLPLVKQKVSKNFTSSSSKLKLDGIFVAIGHKPDTNLFTGQIELDNKDYVITSAKKALEMATLLHSYIDKKEEAMIKQCNNVTMKQFNFSYQSMTSVMGVFAAGDCVDSVYRQASTAAGMGVAAALDAEKWLKSVENS